MTVLLDANVLYPTVLRGILLARIRAGAFQALWSERILEEWRRAALRDGGVDIEVEIAATRAVSPDACVNILPETESALHLPDPADTHVLAAAIDGGADEILTFNTKDFPINTLAGFGILRRHPDEFLLEGYHADPTGMRSDVDAVLAVAAGFGIDVSAPRAIFKRARLPRFGKALYAAP